MGLEQYDFLYEQAQLMLTNLNALLTGLTAMETNQGAITESLATISGGLDSALASIASSDTVTASATITTIKESIEAITLDTELIPTAKVVIEAGITQVNSLIPLITAEVEKLYDPKVKYYYKCNKCSIGCPDVFVGFQPLDKSILKTCKLRGDKSANFKQVDSGVTN